MGGAVRNGAQLLGQRYRLVEQLGAGGMSVVWRGYDEVLGRQVAVKVLASRLAADRAFRHRIRIEAQAAARLCHPHITNVYDYGESEQLGLCVPFVVMELIDGESLTARLSRGRQLSWRDAVVIGAEVSSALATAHARGVVHRDVTPGNVMLTQTGVKVVDFGISALVGESEKGPDGALLGTPAYLAPERLDGGQVSPATDVYAVGLLLYRMLTGRLPWRASTTTQMLRAHLYSDPAPIPPVPGLPDGVAELIHRCLAKRPEDRPASTEVTRVLAGAAGVLASVPVSPAPGPVDPASLANVGTTILPWSADTDALPFSGVRTRTRQAARRRRLEAAAVAAGLVAVTGAMWGVTSDSPANGGADPVEAGMATARPAPCQVDYALRSDTGKDFTADLTLTNTGGEELRDWTMSFTFPGAQAVTEAGPVPVRQDGRMVLLTAAAPGAALVPGGSQKITLTGRYTGANPLPMEFQVGADDCEARVAGVAGSTPSTAPATTAPATTAPATKAPTRVKSTGGGSTATGRGPTGGSKAKSDGKGSGGGGKKAGGDGGRGDDDDD